MAWFHVEPRWDSFFVGWDSVQSFLKWTGILVNLHRGRQVEQVSLPPRQSAESHRECSFFLKKETTVRWRDRFHNAWDGFGWCSTSVREAAIVKSAHAAGIGCPEVVAFGEHRRQAFVLLRDESDLTDLRVFLEAAQCERERQAVAEALGEHIAHLHNNGFDHPDLFAKHILVGRTASGFRFCILDWARARRRKSVSWRCRRRQLAVLGATLHDSLASGRLRLRFLRAYRRTATQKMEALPLPRLADEIRGETDALRQRRSIRELGQRAIPAADQQFVSIPSPRLLIVRSHFERFGGQLPDWLIQAGEGGPTEVLESTIPSGFQFHGWPGSSFEMTMPPLAHVLFHLQRFGVPVPKLIAVGVSGDGTFAVTHLEPTMPFHQFFADASPASKHRLLCSAGKILRQIHDAGFHLPPGDSWARRIAVVQGSEKVVIAEVNALARSSVSWRDLFRADFSHVISNFSRADQIRFLKAYLGASFNRETVSSVLTSTETPRERQLPA